MAYLEGHQVWGRSLRPPQRSIRPVQASHHGWWLSAPCLFGKRLAWTAWSKGASARTLNTKLNRNHAPLLRVRAVVIHC